MPIRPILFSVLAVAVMSCNQNIKKEPQAPQSQTRFVNPPNEKWNVPYKEYTVEASRGDTLFHPSGSILEFPANAFVDKQGKVITGKVQVKYREFSSPIDFYLAGIPMQYDSAGTNYLFSSSAMCEIYAYKDGQPVFVNPASKPSINMATENVEPGHNLYYLDTVQKHWVYEGANKIINFAPVTDSAMHDVAERVAINIEPPVKPQEANDKTPVIRIEIDKTSLKEFMGYDNLQFQLEPNQQFNPSDTLQEWTDVDVQRGSDKDQYIVKFSNSKKSVLYKARPVFESKDYKAALKEFDKKNKEYQSKIITKRRAEALQKRKNKVTIARNAETERLNAIIEARNARTARDQFRSFLIDKWGTWNCDLLALPHPIDVDAIFKDPAGNTIELTDVGVLYKRVTGYKRSYNNTRVTLDRDGSNMIVGITDGKFAYMRYDRYDSLMNSINHVISEKQIFVMSIVNAHDSSYEFLKSIALPVQRDTSLPKR